MVAEKHSIVKRLFFFFFIRLQLKQQRQYGPCATHLCSCCLLFSSTIWCSAPSNVTNPTWNTIWCLVRFSRVQAGGAVWGFCSRGYFKLIKEILLHSSEEAGLTGLGHRHAWKQQSGIRSREHSNTGSRAHRGEFARHKTYRYWGIITEAFRDDAGHWSSTVGWCNVP